MNRIYSSFWEIAPTFRRLPFQRLPSVPSGGGSGRLGIMEGHGPHGAVPALGDKLVPLSP